MQGDTVTAFYSWSRKKKRKDLFNIKCVVQKNQWPDTQRNRSKGNICIIIEKGRRNTARIRIRKEYNNRTASPCPSTECLTSVMTEICILCSTSDWSGCQTSKDNSSKSQNILLAYTQTFKLDIHKFKQT